ncbi:Eukaryotic translation initiation factor 2B, subunit 4 delta, 67kDa [Cyanidiococcus yangmingshanensis]|uniref:Translation initiation factor eIF2B subunit delta n=1 Tax=Cyanidiococcus yangmingshanensis TaxID=2690220 RepID=A0A7J7IHQ6_9RHOD|nr:Eukaryotic translation initiation factor 2B, subunit 4 delta, 67kDa [Cyanidiococcus yangmingshanensis]
MSTRGARAKQRLQYDDPDAVAKAEKRVVLKRAPAQRLVPLFAHLPQYEPLRSASVRVSLAETLGLHPSVLQLGQQLAQGIISGGTARVAALLTALREVIADFPSSSTGSSSTSPLEAEHLVDDRRELERSLNRHIQFLVDSRPLSVAMGNAVRFVKSRLGIQSLAPTFRELQRQLLNDIDAFIEERIVFALETIFEAGAERIRDGDVVLTYDASYAVESILLRAMRKLKRRFRVIVLDSRPRYRGHALANRLLQHGITHCTYSLLHAGAYAHSGSESCPPGRRGLFQQRRCARSRWNCQCGVSGEARAYPSCRCL